MAIRGPWGTYVAPYLLVSMYDVFVFFFNFSLFITYRALILYSLQSHKFFIAFVVTVKISCVRCKFFIICRGKQNKTLKWSLPYLIFLSISFSKFVFAKSRALYITIFTFNVQHTYPKMLWTCKIQCQTKTCQEHPPPLHALPIFQQEPLIRKATIVSSPTTASANVSKHSADCWDNLRFKPYRPQSGH